MPRGVIGEAEREGLSSWARDGSRAGDGDLVLREGLGNREEDLESRDSRAE